ncbi:GNAT family N-acetyltransferase [Actinokineospora bangkokensis]|uniref:GNAT family N-acetyltransferase n=1 Tax=Actinokineospora bangkokensis TaxID=1193682 RepID=UPI001E588DA7|nr:GNAT family protein [Actinokineospora bangkokensis]
MHLTGGSTRLREVRTSDLADSLAVVGDDRVTAWLSFDPLDPAQQADRLAAVVERAAHRPRQEYYLAVTALDNDRLVGVARLGLGRFRSAEVGYAIAHDHWGRGHATDAVGALLAFGFADLGLHRVTAAISPDNAASIRVVRKLGFELEGRMRDHVHAGGRWRDSLLYAKVARGEP